MLRCIVALVGLTMVGGTFAETNDLAAADGTFASTKATDGLSRLQQIGKMQVLAGDVQITHYGEDKFDRKIWERDGEISGVYIGEASFRITVDFAKSIRNDKGQIVIPMPTDVWFALDENKTRVFKNETWEKGKISPDDRASFGNRHLACAEKKATYAVLGRKKLFTQAASQARKIAQAYLGVWGFPNEVVTTEE